jgi:nucleotide-binding universal stress UspA family protein
MSSTIIVGYDCSEASEDALAFAKLMAGATDAHLVVAGVFRLLPVWDVPSATVEEWAPDRNAQLEAAAASVAGEAMTIPSASPARGLQDLARGTGADLVIVGSARHGTIGQVLAGNAGLSLLHGSHCSVAVAPLGFARKAVDRIAEVVVAYDGSPQSAAAMRDAVNLARGAGAPLKVVTVAEPPPVVYGKGGGAHQGRQELTAAIEDIMRTRMEEAFAGLPDDVPAEAVLVTGDPAEELARVAVKDGAVLMLGSRSYGPIRSVLLGSVSRHLMRSAPVPVVVHPRTARESETANARQVGRGAAVPS